MAKEIGKGYAVGKLNVYNRFFEYQRIISEVSITDEGVYQKGQVPDTYGGAQLDLQVVHAVFMVNGQSELQIHEFEVPYPMDKTKKTGGRIMRDGKEVRAKTGDSTVDVVQTTVVNPNLDDVRKALGLASLTAFKADLAAQPDQPKS